MGFGPWAVWYQSLGPYVYCTQLNELGNCRPAICYWSEDRTVGDTVALTVLIVPDAQSVSTEVLNGLPDLSPAHVYPSIISKCLYPRNSSRKHYRIILQWGGELLVSGTRDNCLGRGWERSLVKILPGLPQDSLTLPPKNPPWNPIASLIKP